MIQLLRDFDDSLLCQKHNLALLAYNCFNAVHDRGVLYPQGSRVQVSTGKGTSAGSYPASMCLEHQTIYLTKKTVISSVFLIVFKQYLDTKGF